MTTQQMINCILNLTGQVHLSKLDGDTYYIAATIHYPSFEGESVKDVLTECILYLEKYQNMPISNCK